MVGSKDADREDGAPDFNVWNRRTVVVSTFPCCEMRTPRCIMLVGDLFTWECLLISYHVDNSISKAPSQSIS